MTPVFFHIPKCGGTYAISWQLLFLNHYLKASGYSRPLDFARNLNITDGGSTILRVLGVGECSGFERGDDPTHFKVSLGDFVTARDSFQIFAIVIEPHGFRRWEEALLKMGVVAPLKWMLVRHPYEVARSFFYYITSPASNHEAQRPALGSRSLVEYIGSREVSDSWLIRNLLDLPDSTLIGDAEIGRAQEVLSDFKVKDIMLALPLIDSVFLQCYNISSADVSLRARKYVRMNASDGAKVHFYDLPREVQETFLKRAEPDLRLYGWAVADYV